MSILPRAWGKFAICCAVMFICALHTESELERALCCGALAARRICSAVRFRIDFGSRSKRELASHDDCFVGLDAAFNDDEIPILPLTGFDRTKIDRVVRLQHKYERPTLANLDSLRWNEPRVFNRVENETNTHKFRRPKRVVRIGRHSTRFHGSRTGLDGGVDEIQIAQTRRNFIVRRIGLHFHVRTAEIFPHQRQISLSNGEVGVNRIEALNCKQYGAATRVARDYVAHIDKSQSSAAVDRRFYIAKIHMYLISPSCRFGLACVSFSSVEILQSCDVSRAQLRLPLHRSLV